MPRTKKIPNLLDLCVDNVALNIVGHNERLKNHGTDEVWAQYGVLQFICSDALLKKVFGMICNNQGNKNLRRLHDFIFESKEPGKISDWPILKILFNKFTTCFQPSTIRRYVQDHDSITDVTAWHKVSFCKLKNNELSDGFLSFVTSECKNLRKLNKGFCFLTGKRLGETIPQFQKLLEVDLGVIKNRDILIRILKSCPLLRKLSADGTECTSDNFLLSLCKYSSGSEMFPYCPDNGHCSESGKYLKSLRVLVTCTVGEGIACGLQHLPELKDVVELPARTYHVSASTIDVTKGIAILEKATRPRGRPRVILKLESFALKAFTDFCSMTFNGVLSRCPRLQAIQINVTRSWCTCNPRFIEVQNLKELHLFDSDEGGLNSSHISKLFTAYGSKLTTLSFLIARHPIDIACINNFLNRCCNLRSFTLWCFAMSGNPVSTDMRDLPVCVNSLEKFVLEVPRRHVFPQWCRDYFRKLISAAPNLKYLSVSSVFAETEFPRIIEENDFPFLEELCIKDADTREIPFHKLLKGSCSLRKIKFSGRNSKHGVLLCNRISRVYNYQLEIVHE